MQPQTFCIASAVPIHVTPMGDQANKQMGQQHAAVGVEHSSKATLYQEIEQHLLEDESPSVWLNQIRKDRRFEEHPFTMLLKLRATPQSPKHHPEGSVWNHTMMVVDEAARRKGESHNPRAFLWAALLHDVGKAPTTKMRKGKLTSYDHDKVGAGLAREFLREFTEDEAFIERVCGLILYHMQILYVEKGLPQADLEGMRAHTDASEVALLGLCDRLGRGGSDEKKEGQIIQSFLESTNKLN